MENEEKELEQKDKRTWILVQRPYVTCCSLHAIPEACAYVETFLRHPRCAWRFK